MKYTKEGEGRECEGVVRGPCVSSSSVGYIIERDRGGGGGEEVEFFPSSSLNTKPPTLLIILL